jgi:hypothetical protein
MTARVDLGDGLIKEVTLYAVVRHGKVRIEFPEEFHGLTPNPDYRAPIVQLRAYQDDPDMIRLPLDIDAMFLDIDRLYQKWRGELLRERDLRSQLNSWRRGFKIRKSRPRPTRGLLFP